MSLVNPLRGLPRVVGQPQESLANAGPGRAALVDSPGSGPQPSAAAVPGSPLPTPEPAAGPGVPVRGASSTPLGAATTRLASFHARAVELRSAVADMQALFAERPDLLPRLQHLVLQVTSSTLAIESLEPRLERLLADPWVVERGGHLPEQTRLNAARTTHATATRELAALRAELADRDPIRVAEQCRALVNDVVHTSEHLIEVLRANGATPEMRRLLREGQLIESSQALFDALWPSAAAVHLTSLSRGGQTGDFAMPLGVIAASIEAAGSAAWPNVEAAGTVRRVMDVQRALLGDWPAHYAIDFSRPPGAPDGEVTTRVESLHAFNRAVSPLDRAFYFHGNRSLVAPLDALGRVPAGPERSAAIAEMREHDVVGTLFQRLTTRYFDSSVDGVGPTSSGSSQLAGIGDTFVHLLRDAPELRSELDRVRFDVRIPPEEPYLPPQWSIRQWLGVNAVGGDDEPFWTYDGAGKGHAMLSLRAAQRLLAGLQPD